MDKATSKGAGVSMAKKGTALTECAAWQALASHYQKIKDVHLRRLFADNPRRAERFAVEDVGLYLDYSKNRITEETFALLVKLDAPPQIAFFSELLQESHYGGNICALGEAR